MIGDLQRLIEVYLEGGRNRTLQTLAVKSGVSYSTLRRIAQGEVKTTDLSNALGILLVTTDWQRSLAFLKSYFPEAGRYYETIVGQRGMDAEINENLIDSLRDFHKFVAISLAAVPHGTTRDKIFDVMGKRADSVIDDLVSAEVLASRGGRIVVTTQKFGSLDLALQTIQVGHCLSFICKENRGKRRQHAGIFTDGVSLEGQREVHEILEKALEAVHTVVAKKPGDLPIFYGAIMGSFVMEADHA